MKTIIHRDIESKKSDTLLKKYLSIQLFNQFIPNMYCLGSDTLKSGPAPAFDHISYQLDKYCTVSIFKPQKKVSGKHRLVIGYIRHPVAEIFIIIIVKIDKLENNRTFEKKISLIINFLMSER